MMGVLYLEHLLIPTGFLVATTGSLSTRDFVSL
jgi:hypothetical protein